MDGVPCVGCLGGGMIRPERTIRHHTLTHTLTQPSVCYPNIAIAYRIFFTMPVTVASAERSFSKLKLLKNYLRSTMSQERLNGLATLCIEKNLLDEIDIDTIVSDFASQNVMRKF